VPDSVFDEQMADQYDEDCSDMFAAAVIDPTADFLVDLAGDGGALEFGIGTGRVALPLAQRGVRVHGIDVSPAMVERLRGKPRGEAITVTIGDFTTTRVGGASRSSTSSTTRS
jgi:16S rRNA A1518/A1519 N6-dimethyltransferase RsmA/KsgA/DIM1 with predicted DNA glycosylase/AP lyase activity